MMTQSARSVLAECDCVVGYSTYIRLISDLISDKEVVQTGMQGEVERAQVAIERARAGRQVAAVSSGDAGVYGMAGVIFEVLLAEGWRPGDAPSVEVIPGLPALVAVAALLGAPLTQDFAAISLSDLLTPWSTIARRLEAAAAADFVIALYNPRSEQRTQPLTEAKVILERYRSPETPVGIVRAAHRERQSVIVTTLSDLPVEVVDMLTLVIVGNSQTLRVENCMVTPRGYGGKYRLAKEEPVNGGQ